MKSIWVESLGYLCDETLDQLAAAMRECPDDLWSASMWAVPTDAFGTAPPGPDGQPATDPAVRYALAQRRSTPWSVAWHALETLDYDLTGEFGPWAPPPPFADHPHWLLTRLPAPWTRSDLLGYVDYCRQRARDTLAGMTDERAAAPLPQAHRYHGQPHARIITSAVGHTIEHAAQIKQFITDSRLASASRGIPGRVPLAAPQSP